MGITIVQKGNLKDKRRDSLKALILAGGAVTGGSFKAGGLKALNDYFVNFSVNDFDIYVGMSSGSLLAAPLVGGISPESILKSLDGTSRHFSPLSAWHYYRPNVAELFVRPMRFFAQVAGLLPGRLVRLISRYPEWSRGMLGNIWKFLERPTIDSYENMMAPILSEMGSGDFPSIIEILPSGIFDNSSIEAYVRGNIERNGLINDFREIERTSGKKLYISAMRLDGAKRAVFGPDEDASLTLSEAIQASTALPGFYKPARINGVDYVDGGVQRTANIDIAVDKGAGLIVCYNPFRPYEPREFVRGLSGGRKEGSVLASSGILAVLNQIFRAFFHSRLEAALDHFRKSDDFRGDIILIEPRADDEAFFALNPLALRNRIEAAKLGFWSVRNSIDERFDEISRIMDAYGIQMSREGVEKEFRIISGESTSKSQIQMLLEGRKSPEKGRRVGRGRARVRRAVSRIKRKGKKRSAKAKR